MKVAYVITRADEIGGAHVHVRDMARWMRDQGHDVKVFVGSEGAFLEWLDEEDIPYVKLRHMVRSISVLSDFYAVSELRAALREYQPDLVSSHSAKAGAIARVACWKSGLPCLFTAHGWSFTSGVGGLKAYAFRMIERLLAPLACRIITVCEADRLLAMKARVASSSMLTVIHNGMPFAPLVVRGPGGDDEQPVRLMMVARFEAQKDHETLLRALAKRKEGNWFLELIGEGGLRSRAEDICESLGLSSKVKFLGRRSDVPTLLEQADVFVLSTHWEGFPRSILEAMRAALPVVATDVAGVAESVIDGVTGFLVRHRDEEQLAQRLACLINDDSLRYAMGMAGREMFIEKFTFDRMANQTLDLYKECIVRT